MTELIAVVSGLGVEAQVTLGLGFIAFVLGTLVLDIIASTKVPKDTSKGSESGLDCRLSDEQKALCIFELNNRRYWHNRTN